MKSLTCRRAELPRWPIMALCLLIGVYPQPVLDSIKPDIDVVAKILADRQVSQRQSDCKKRLRMVMKLQIQATGTEPTLQICNLRLNV